jgi:hypothetical protein
LGGGEVWDAETYMVEIMDKEIFDFWQERMEEWRMGLRLI